MSVMSQFIYEDEWESLVKDKANGMGEREVKESQVWLKGEDSRFIYYCYSFLKVYRAGIDYSIVY